MPRQLSLAICVCVIVSLSLTALSGCGKAGGQAAFSMPPTKVTTAPVSLGDVPVYLDEIGKTTSAEVVNVVPQVTGMIVARSFEDGSDLHKGEKLFQIDPRPFQASLDQAEAMLQQSRAQLDNAKTNFDRIASELPSKAVSQQDYDTAKNNVAVGQANVKAAEAAVETARLNVGYCTIVSPLDGRAGERLVDVGNVVNANTTSLLIIQRLAPIYVDFTIPENELDRVRQNMSEHPLKVMVDSPDGLGKSIEGSVTFLDNAVQDGTGTIKLRAVVANKDHGLWPGQFVHVRLILKTLHDALLVPNEAVQIGQQGPYVFVLKTDPQTGVNTALQQPIVPGQRQGSAVVIESGLAAGQTVVRSGQLMVIPGMPVQVDNATAAASGAWAGGAKQ